MKLLQVPNHPKPPSSLATKSHNALINRHSSTGNHRHVLLLYFTMLNAHIPPDPYTYPSMLKACTSLNLFSLGLSFHQHLLVNGYSSDSYISASLINFYSKFGFADVAYKVFDVMPDRNVVPWTAVIGCYTRYGDVNTAFRMYKQMQCEGVRPSSVTILTMVSGVSEYAHVQSFHACSIRYGFVGDLALANSVLNSYGKCRRVSDASNLFESMDKRDIVSWNSLVSAYALVGNVREISQLLYRMWLSELEPDQQTFGSLISAVTRQGNQYIGKVVHGKVVIPSTTTIACALAACAQLGSFRVGTSIHDVVSWNAMVAGHAQNGQLFNALYVFNEMRKSFEKPDAVTVVSLLQACASVGAHHQGKWIHNFIIRNSLESSLLIDTAIIDMYCKCGNIDSARKCFDRMSKHDVVTWSTMIGGYGSHGKGEDALDMFMEFLQSGLEPNHVIFLSVLYSCSHNGLVDEGLALFNTMKDRYKIEPKLEHCACIVDLLCRAGRTTDAYDFYKKTFMEPVVDVLGILLDACRSKGNKELGDVIASEIHRWYGTDGSVGWNWGVMVAAGSPAVSSDGLGKSNGDDTPFGKKIGAMEKVLERRQRRMIKNQESAARSHTRKQVEVKCENADSVLKHKQEVITKSTAQIIHEHNV
ncbi:hypothetical protein M8C21_026011, partial [Ambrosia artemisiifolia]